MIINNNLKLYATSEVYKVNNANYVYLNIPQAGDTLINAYNQNRDGNNANITAICSQGGTYLVFFDRVVNGNIQLATIWCRF